MTPKFEEPKLDETVIDTRKSVKISLELHEKLSKLAKKHRRTIAAQLEYLIDNAE